MGRTQHTGSLPISAQMVVKSSAETGMVGAVFQKADVSILVRLNTDDAIFGSVKYGSVISYGFRSPDRPRQGH